MFIISLSFLEVELEVYVGGVARMAAVVAGEEAVRGMADAAGAEDGRRMERRMEW